MNEPVNNFIGVICIISKCYELPFKHWTCDIKNSKYEYSHSDEYKNIHQNITYKMSSGIVFKFNDVIYIVTPGHSTKNSISSHFYVNSPELTKIELSKIVDIDEYDLSILTPNTFYDNVTLYSLPLILPTTTNLSILYANTIDSSEQVVLLNYNKIQCEYHGISLMKIKSLILPQIPVLNITLVDETLSYSGLSGGVICDKENVYGIISNYCTKDNQIKAIPSFCIIQILNNLIKSECELHTIFLDTQVCEFGEEGTVQIGHIVTNNNISYKTTSTKQHKFKTGDIIYEINSKSFTESGKILCDTLNIELPFDTYIMLNSINSLKIKYYAKTK